MLAKLSAPILRLALVLGACTAMAAAGGGASALGLPERVAHAQQTAPSLDSTDPRQVSPTPGPGTEVRAPGAGRPLASEVEVTLVPSRDNLTAGDLWSVSGEIHNRSKDRPIWIVDRKTMLTFSPEVYGAASDRVAFYAYFPFVDYDFELGYEHAVRIDPDSKYAVIWRMPNAFERGAGNAWLRDWLGPNLIGLLNMFLDPLRAVVNYLYFYPGTFRATATLHVWYENPPLSPQTGPKPLTPNDAAPAPADTTNAFLVTASREIRIEASPWVLIIGAAVGGLLCRSLQLLLGELPAYRRDEAASGEPRRRRRAFWGWLRWSVNGVGAAALLPAVATVLLSRLSASDFPLAVSVRDVWGAIATGFVVQWLGVSWLKRLIGGEEKERAGGPARTRPARAGARPGRSTTRRPPRIRSARRGGRPPAVVRAGAAGDAAPPSNGQPAAVPPR